MYSTYMSVDFLKLFTRGLPINIFHSALRLKSLGLIPLLPLSHQHRLSGLSTCPMFFPTVAPWGQAFAAGVPWWWVCPDCGDFGFASGKESWVFIGGRQISCQESSSQATVCTVQWWNKDLCSGGSHECWHWWFAGAVANHIPGSKHIEPPSSPS